METKSFTLNQLIDISLNSPDIGVVNFKILRTVLKVIVRELDIHDVKARVLVKDLQETANLMLSADRKISPKESPIKMQSDYKTQEHKSVKQLDAETIKIPSEELLEEEIRNETVELEEITDLVEESDIDKENEDKQIETLVITNSVSSELLHADEYERTKIKEEISNIEELDVQNEVESLEEHMIGIQTSLKTIKSEATSAEIKSIGEDSFIIESAKHVQRKSSDHIRKSSDTFCTGNRWFVANMWKTMNFARRVDALEMGIEKIVCSLNIHAKFIDRQRRDFEVKKKDDSAIKDNIEENIINILESLNTINNKLELFVLSEQYENNKIKTDTTISGLLTDINQINQVASKIKNLLEGERNLESTYEQLDELTNRIMFLEENTGLGNEKDRTFDLATLGRLFEELIEKVQPIIEKFEKEEELEVDNSNIVEQVMNCRLSLRQLTLDLKRMKDHLELLTYDLNKQMETVEILVDAQEKGFTAEDKEIFYEMQKRLRNLEKECEQIDAIEELQNVIGQMEFSKANKEEMERALQDKANIHDMKEKVNKNEYDLTICDMTNGMQELMTKIISQEQSLQRIVKNLTDDLDSKVDSYNLENITERIQSRINALNIKLKQIKTMVESETPIPAGTKLQIAKCISCERPTKIYRPSFIKSSSFETRDSTKINPNVAGVVAINDKNFVPNSECNHVGRTTGGPHTVMDPEIRRTKFPPIIEKSTFTENIHKRTGKKSTPV